MVCIWNCLKAFSLSTLFYFRANSHSWVECTDYDITLPINDNSYDESDCSGWARSWGNYGSTYFGEDKGAHDDITYDNYMCTDSIGSPNDYSSTYSAEYPMASYTVGETIRLLWPSKNHANYECLSFQLDNAMKLFVNNNNPNPTSDLGRSTDEWTLVIDWHDESGATFIDSATDGDANVRSTIGVDGVPYQNCPHFCDHTDYAVCYGDFVVPDIFPQDGVYTFVWYWEFKSNEIYSHCFEAYVTTSGGNAATPSPVNNNNPNTPSPVANNPNTPSPVANDPNTPSPVSNNNNNNNNGGENGNDDTIVVETTSADTITVTYYIYHVPVCIGNAEYDEDIIVNSLTNLFSSGQFSDNTYETVQYSRSNDGKSFNATIQISTQIPQPVSRMILNDTVCSVIAEGLNGTCSICDELWTNTVSETETNTENSSSGNDDNGALVGILIGVFVGLIIIAAIICFVLYKKGLLCAGGSSNKSNNNNQFASGASTTNLATSTGQTNAIVAAGDGEPHVTGARPSGPPPVPGHIKHHKALPSESFHAGTAHGARPPPPRPPPRF